MKNELFKRILSSIILIPLVFLTIYLGSYYFNFLILVCLLIISYEWYAMTKKKLYILFGYCFLIFSFYSIYKIRNIYDEGFEFVFLIMIICICSDIGGFLFGKIFKGPKLTKLSPNKTYSGVVGAYLLTISTIYFLENQNVIFNLKILSSLNIYLYIILVSTMSQIGDIFISYFKRLSKIKDTGKIIPGHGGLLDRADGMIFAFPFSYIIFLLVEI